MRRICWNAAKAAKHPGVGARNDGTLKRREPGGHGGEAGHWGGDVRRPAGAELTNGAGCAPSGG
jgi:hypothetical protein